MAIQKPFVCRPSFIALSYAVHLPARRSVIALLSLFILSPPTPPSSPGQSVLVVISISVVGNMDTKSVIGYYRLVIIDVIALGLCPQFSIILSLSYLSVS